jgi:hypothetical protein
MKIDTRPFRVHKGARVKLKGWATRVKPFYESKSDYHDMLDAHVRRLSKLQDLLYAHDRYAVLLVFQAMDAAGKDGAIKHVMSGVNPQGCEVYSFKQPSTRELEHDFLWRTTCCLPERGRIGIFNRSYYEEVLVVHPTTSPGAARSEGPVAGALRLDSGSGEASEPQRDTDRQVLSAPVEGGTATAVSEATQRPDEELEIQPRGHEGAATLERLHARV